MQRLTVMLLTSCCLLDVGRTAAGVDAPPPTVSQVPRAQITSISRQIDALVESQLAAHEQRPNRRADDETFLRRIYLDVAGRIPTLAEARSFLQSRSRDKRGDLIDHLLDSPAYASHHFNYWADLLRVKSRLTGGNPGAPYIEYVRESLAENKPYDQFVRELLTASGPVWERGNGATGFYLRDAGMPEDQMANTVRVFLGTRLECAQCHDHPFDTWTQREFYEMVAFTGGVQTRMPPTSAASGRDLRRKLRESGANAKVQQAAIRLLRPLSYGVSGGGTGLARLPDDYQYNDGEPDEIVAAKTMFAHESLVDPTIPPRSKVQPSRRPRRLAPDIPGAEDVGSRAAFAAWLTSPDNPRFTLVIANRLWKKAMGRGLIEPVDDITAATVASNPELMSLLAEQMIELDYDMKQFLRAVYNSDAYQRQATDRDVDDETEFLFPGPVLRRMSAEQLWDSFLTLAVPELDERQGPRRNPAFDLLGGDDPYESFADLQDMSVDQIIELAEERVALQADPAERRRRIRAKVASSQDDAFGEQRRAHGVRITQLQNLAKQARRRGDPVALRRVRAEIAELAKEIRHAPGRQGPGMVRASELPSPAPPGHFLREFGQSDREQIDNANTEAAVNQVLSLMNGTIEKRIISNPRTVLMRDVVDAGSLAEQIEVVFLSMLSRRPTRAESTTWQQTARENPQEAATDLIWTLANSSEFIFVR